MPYAVTVTDLSYDENVWEDESRIVALFKTKQAAVEHAFNYKTRRDEGRLADGREYVSIHQPIVDVKYIRPTRANVRSIGGCSEHRQSNEGRGH